MDEDPLGDDPEPVLEPEPEPEPELPLLPLLPEELSPALLEDDPESLPLAPELDEPLVDLFCLLEEPCFLLLLEDEPEALPLPVSVLMLLLGSELRLSDELEVPLEAAIAALTESAKTNAKDCLTNFILISYEKKSL